MNGDKESRREGGGKIENEYFLTLLICYQVLVEYYRQSILEAT